MIRLLQFLWSGCFHQWETDRVEQYTYEYRYGSRVRTINCAKYTLRCTKCGAMKAYLNK